MTSRTQYAITHTLRYHHTIRYHAHNTLSRTQYVITHTSTLAVKAMFISRGLRVFQSRMTPTSTLSAGMLNETLCRRTWSRRRNWLRRRNCGNTGRCIAGIYLRNLSPEYYHHGQSWPIMAHRSTTQLDCSRQRSPYCERTQSPSHERPAWPTVWRLQMDRRNRQQIQPMVNAPTCRTAKEESKTAVITPVPFSLLPLEPLFHKENKICHLQRCKILFKTFRH